MSRADEQRVEDIVAFAAELAVIVAAGENEFLQNPIARRAAERLLSDRRSRERHQ